MKLMVVLASAFVGEQHMPRKPVCWRMQLAGPASTATGPVADTSATTV